MKKNYSKQFSVYNGNGKLYASSIPLIVIKTSSFNDIAKKHFEKCTGLTLGENIFNTYKIQPKTFKQFFKIFATYNFKTTRYDNASFKNQIHLEFNH